MLELTSFEWALWALIAVSQAAITVFLWTSGLWKRWVSVFAYLALSSVKTFILFLIPIAISAKSARNPTYFYTYWTANFLLNALQIWVAIEIGHRVIGVTKKSVVGFRFLFRKWRPLCFLS